MSEAQRYHVIERIAAGGMAEVYRGESAGIEGFRKKVAIKRVLPKLSANTEFIAMFLDEARLGAYLSHSRCVQVFDIGQGGGSHFIVMEFVDGADLKEVMEFLSARGQAMRVEVACRIAMDVCEGLAYAHQARDHSGHPLEIVHRDISPHNVLMTRFGEVKLVDFGLAKASSHLSAEDEDVVKGKFGYLAPEITLGQRADKRVDIFAAGILLWEMLCGRRLFQGPSDVETFKLVRAAEIPDPRQYRKEVPEELVRVLLKALARDPGQRYATADAFGRDLSLVAMGLGKPATYLDVAEPVKGAADERLKTKRAAGKDTAGVMGDIIIDALHEFSGAPGSVLPEEVPAWESKPLEVSPGYEDPSQWDLGSMLDEPPKPASPLETAAAPLGAKPPPPPPRAPKPGAPAAAPPPQAQEEAPAPRARVQETPAKKEGPFWRRWFGG